MSPASNLVIKYLKDHGPRTLDEIHAELPEEVRQQFRKRINNLRALGHLEMDKDPDGVTRYRLAPEAVRKAVRQELTEKRLQEAAMRTGPLPIVPPRRIDVMNSTWTPQPDPVLRPGANDYRAIPSHGHGC